MLENYGESSDQGATCPSITEIERKIAEWETAARKRRIKQVIARFTCVAMGVLGGAAWVNYFDEDGYGEVESEMTDAVEAIIGEDAIVKCATIINKGSSKTEEAQTFSLGGYAWDESKNQHRIYIDPFFCETLKRTDEISDSDTTQELTEDEYALVLSFQLLGHEIGHAEGILDEGKANCRGIELYDDVAVALGTSPIIGMDEMWSIVRLLPQPAEYHSAGC